MNKMIRDFYPYLMMLSMIGNSIYCIPKQYQYNMGNAYPTQRGKLKKSILTIHKQMNSSKYNK